MAELEWIGLACHGRVLAITCLTVVGMYLHKAKLGGVACNQDGGTWTALSPRAVLDVLCLKHLISATILLLIDGRYASYFHT